MAPRKDGKEFSKVTVVPSPAQLERYLKIGKRTPAQVLRSRDRQLHREYYYALMSSLFGLISFLALISLAATIVLHGHPRAGVAFLGTGALTLVGGFIRARLLSQPGIKPSDPSTTSLVREEVVVESVEEEVLPKR